MNGRFSLGKRDQWEWGKSGSNETDGRLQTNQFLFEFQKSFYMLETADVSSLLITSSLTLHLGADIRLGFGQRGGTKSGAHLFR